MANMLAWLTGRDDQTAQPSPVQWDDGQQSLTAYHPSPSEAFGNWISDALGGGPQASVAHQNFATGLPSVLSLFPPLGIGLSAADFAHAKAANDPAGAAAAAIGLIPGAGPEARAGMKALQEAPIGQLAQIMKEFTGSTDAVKLAAAPKPPILDYQKDDTGLYHIFDALSGKTVKIADTQNEAKGWIAKQTGPINQISTPPMKETKAPDLLEAQKRYEAAIAPLAQNLPERAQAQGYTTPAFRGMSVYQKGGVPNPVFDFDKSENLYSSSSPMLADMYSSYLSHHPGWDVPRDVFKEGAQVSPLLLNTSDYHYYDAKGAHWSSSMGNQRGIREAQAAGKPGVIIDNVWDEPNSTHALGQPHKVIVTFPEGASTAKSRFAERFDPSSPNMLHGLLAMLGAGGAIEAANQGDQKQ